MSLALLALMLFTSVRGQTPAEMRWFNYKPILEVSTVGSLGDGFVAFDGNLVVLSTGATLGAPVGTLDVATIDSRLFTMTMSGSVFEYTGSSWTALGAFQGMSESGNGLWFWTATSALNLSSGKEWTVPIPPGATFVSGTPSNAVVVAGSRVHYCKDNGCELVEGVSCEAAWQIGDHLTCYRSNVLEIESNLFEHVSSISEFGNKLYFIDGSYLYAYSGTLFQLLQVGPGSFIEGDFVVTPAGAYRIDGTSVRKISNRIRSTVNERLRAGPALVNGDYRLTYTPSAWVDEFTGSGIWRREGLLAWEPGTSEYVWDNTPRLVRGQIVSAMGDDQEGYLLVKQSSALTGAGNMLVGMESSSSNRLMVYDAVTGKPMTGLSKPVFSYGYTGKHYYVATASEIKLLSLGALTTMAAAVPPEGVLEWQGNLYYWSDRYLIGPKVYRFPDPLLKAVGYTDSLLVLTSSTLYMVKGSQVFDLGSSYGGFPKDTRDVVVDGENIYLMSGSGVYGLLPQMRVIFYLGRDYYLINGVSRAMEVTATLINSRTMIPIRAVSEAFGYDVSWDTDTFKVTIVGFGHSIELWRDKKEALVDGVPVQVDVAPTLVAGVMLVPVRFVSESMGLMVTWYGSEAKVEVKLP